MRSKILLLLLNIFFILFTFNSNFHGQTLTPEQIYKKITNTVVVVHAYDHSNELVKQGSGVVLNDKGYVVTNYHVLANCDRLEIIHNKEIIPYVDIIGIDVEKDILILKIKAKKFPAIKIGDSEKLNIGQRVYAIGSPLGFENTISEGIISGLRSYEETGQSFIQITASISPGSSGGAVVNNKGELIGISTLTVKEGQNLNFAIPINDVLGIEISSYSKNDAYKDFELFSKGSNAAEKADYYEAITYFSLYIEKFPNSARAYFNRGVVKGNLNDYKGEIQDYDKAIENDPNLLEAYFNRGVVKGKLKDYKGEIQDYDKAIENDPNFVGAYLNRGNAKFNLYNIRGAIEDYNKVIELRPNDAIAYTNRGLAKFELKDYRGAIQDYSKAIEINPNDAVLCFKRGLSKCLLKDRAGGCLDMSKAGELGHPDAYNFIRDICN